MNPCLQNKVHRAPAACAPRLPEVRLVFLVSCKVFRTNPWENALITIRTQRNSLVACVLLGNVCRPIAHGRKISASKTPRSATVVTAHFSEAASTTIDIATTAAASELVKSASQQLVNQALNTQVDGHSAVTFLQTLHHALQGKGCTIGLVVSGVCDRWYATVETSTGIFRSVAKGLRTVDGCN